MLRLGLSPGKELSHQIRWDYKFFSGLHLSMSKDAWEYQEVKWALLFCSFSAFPELSSDELDHDYTSLRKLWLPFISISSFWWLHHPNFKACGTAQHVSLFAVWSTNMVNWQTRRRAKRGATPANSIPWLLKNWERQILEQLRTREADCNTWLDVNDFVAAFYLEYNCMSCHTFYFSSFRWLSTCYRKASGWTWNKQRQQQRWRTLCLSLSV